MLCVCQGGQGEGEDGCGVSAVLSSKSWLRNSSHSWIWVELGQGFTKHNLSFIPPVLMDEAFEEAGGALTPCI